MSEPVGDFIAGDGWRRAPASPRGGVAAAFGVRSPEARPRTRPPAQAAPATRFGDALAVLCSVHRLFLVDGQTRVQGVLAISDVLAAVVAEPLQA